jgi:hypothetical protein
LGGVAASPILFVTRALIGGRGLLLTILFVTRALSFLLDSTLCVMLQRPYSQVTGL